MAYLVCSISIERNLFLAPENVWKEKSDLIELKAEREAAIYEQSIYGSELPAKW
jgi:hypothetical protein